MLRYRVLVSHEGKDYRVGGCNSIAEFDFPGLPDWFDSLRRVEWIPNAAIDSGRLTFERIA